MTTLIRSILATAIVATLGACSPGHHDNGTSKAATAVASSAKPSAPNSASQATTEAVAPDVDKEERPSVAKLKSTMDGYNNIHSDQPIQLPLSDIAINRCRNDFYHEVCAVQYRFGNRIVHTELAFKSGEVDDFKTFPVVVVRDMSIKNCKAFNHGVSCRMGWTVRADQRVLVNPSNGRRDKVTGDWVTVEDEIIFNAQNTKNGTAQGAYANNPLPVYVGIETLRQAAGALVDTLPIVNK